MNRHNIIKAIILLDKDLKSIERFNNIMTVVVGLLIIVTLGFYL